MKIFIVWATEEAGSMGEGYTYVGFAATKEEAEKLRKKAFEALKEKDDFKEAQLSWFDITEDESGAIGEWYQDYLDGL